MSAEDIVELEKSLENLISELNAICTYRDSLFKRDCDPGRQRERRNRSVIQERFVSPSKYLLR